MQDAQHELDPQPDRLTRRVARAVGRLPVLGGLARLLASSRRRQPASPSEAAQGPVLLGEYARVFEPRLFRSAAAAPSERTATQECFAILARPRASLAGRDLQAWLQAVAEIDFPAWTLVWGGDASIDVPDDLASAPWFHMAGSAAAEEAVTAADYVLLASGEELPAPDLFERLERFLCEDPGADVVYFDSDHVDDSGRHVEPRFRYGWCPVLFEDTDFIGESCVIRRALLDAEALRPGALARDTLRDVIRAGAVVRHLPEVLTHRPTRARRSPAPRAARRPRSGGRTPLVSIIVPFKDQVEVLKTCVSSILERSTYSQFEIVLISNNSSEPQTYGYLDEITRRPRITSIRVDEPFNFSMLCNRGAARATGEMLLFLNNDTEVISPQWLEHMLHACEPREVGAVGCKLLFPDDTVQHAGIVLGGGSWPGKPCGVARTMYRGFAPGRDHDAMGVLDSRREVEAATAACLLVERSVFEAIDGFDEARFAIDFNDVDLCLRIQDAGYKVLYEPGAVLYHYESLSRGVPSDAAERERFCAEVGRMYELYEARLDRDRFFNRNLSRAHQTGELYLGTV